MDRQNARINELEGRLIAHRRVLLQLLQASPPDTRAELLDWLDQRDVMHDGQEDPGAVPAEGAGLEMALSDEMRLLNRDLALLIERAEK